jgi:broad specificity phosphatase PhoE
LRLIWLAALIVLQGPPAIADDVLRIYVARHGQTDWNKAGRMQGQKDIPLNETGRGQARELADRMAGVPLDAIYTSALQRSRQTAEPLQGRAPIVALAGLNEQSLGAFEGVSKEDEDRARRADYERREKDPEDTLDGGESTSQHFIRVKAAVQTIRDQHPRGNVLIVAHGGTNVLILRSLLGLDPDQASPINQASDELYMVELRPGQQARLWKLIPPGHLDEL